MLRNCAIVMYMYVIMRPYSIGSMGRLYIYRLYIYHTKSTIHVGIIYNRHIGCVLGFCKQNLTDAQAHLPHSNHRVPVPLYQLRKIGLRMWSTPCHETSWSNLGVTLAGSIVGFMFHLIRYVHIIFFCVALELLMMSTASTWARVTPTLGM